MLKYQELRRRLSFVAKKSQSFLLKKANASKPIGQTFRRWLLICTAAAFATSLIVSFYFETRATQREARQTIAAEIDEAIAQTARANENFERAVETERRTAIRAARAVATILEGAPEILAGTESERCSELEKLATRLGIDKINVVDADGVCRSAWPKYSVNFDFRSNESSREFLQILDDPTLELAQPVRKAAASQTPELYQYSAVARLDAPGIVEIGVRAQEVENARKFVDVAQFIGSFELGKGGFLVLYQGAYRHNPRQISLELARDSVPLDEIFSFKVDGLSYFAFAREADATIFLGALPQTEVYAARRASLLMLIAANFLLFSVVYVLISALVQTLVVGGVYKINRSLGKITNGDLDELVDVRFCKEFDDLSTGVNQTVDALKGAVSEVKRRVAEELELAKKIQIASLPSGFPPFPERTEIDIYAENRAMSSVGGDVYDYFFLDDGRFFFYVADVSGHGVPAALFMMKTMALVKNLARSGLELNRVATEANRYLTENNDAMFVTAFFCVLDVASGRVEYVDAGHNPPAIRRPNGRFEEIAPEINLILGVAADVEYESATFYLAPGDEIFLYTDGVTEATSSATTEFFGTERLLQTLDAASPDAPSLDVVRAVFEAVEKFAAKAERSDDVTALCLKYLGPVAKN